MNDKQAIKKFSFQERVKSFRYAFAGLRQFFREEHNAWIHLGGTTLVIILSLIYKPAGWELIALVVVTGLVWVAELLNTGIENLSDLVTTDTHPRIGFIKDVAAAAVLVTALVAFITGCIIFIPRL